MRTIESILPEISLWQGKTVTYGPLNGGMSNTTYKVFADGVPYAMRINGGQNDYLLLDRLEEAEAIRKAHALGIGMEVLAGTSEYMVTEFFPGQVLTEEKARQPEVIEKIADILRKAHTITGVNRVCSPFDLVGRYLDGARKLNAGWPDGLDDVLREMDAIQNRASKVEHYTEAYCHNDAYAVFNFLENESGELRLIDWELSGVGSIFFDLATVSFHNKYDEAMDTLLLERYFGRVEDEFAGLLWDMKYMNMLREISWALLHHAMEAKSVNHDLNYHECMMFFLNRLKDGFVTP
ncbi:MAG: phosphotransferase family protein [Oscillospiraceae bacterium]|nr:phosphotransferase family protein [Oscillospiraceae bacterium]